MTEWRYLPGSPVKHALDHANDCEAVCGVYTVPADNWRGTGNQREYETVEGLRPCMRCVRKLSGKPS